MTIDTGKFALAAGISAALLWLVCSILVWVAPGMMMSMTGHMLHADLGAVTWHMSLRGVIAGLAIWIGVASILGALIAGIYNRLIIRAST